MMKKNISTVSLFLKFLKFGLFTFGGGYAMIGWIKKEFSKDESYIDPKKLTDYIAIAQSAPGMISLNIANLIGRELKGIRGSLVSVIGVMIPSIIIISLLANFIYFGNGSEFKLDIQFQNILKFVLISVVVILLNAASDLRKIKKRSFFDYFYLIIVFTGVYILSIPISVIVLLNIFVGLIITKVQRKF